MIRRLNVTPARDSAVVTPEGYKISTRYTHRQLATMIGSKRETVTKAFTLLQQAGVVELKRRRIHVKSIDALKKVTNQGLHQAPVS
jgi:DNA-binding transcriptional regulator YhcF (GntR family)